MTSLRQSAWILLGLFFATAASAASFDATNRGWYSQAGAHTATKLDAYAGQGAGTDLYRAYFVFDLGTLARPVGSGVLRLELAGLAGPDAAEVFSVYDVTTNIDDLTATQTGRTDIYTDLGSGVYYGIAAAFASAVGTVIEVPLEPDAIADINRAGGGRFAVGVFVETVGLPIGMEGVRFSLGSEPRVDQLVLEDAPYAPPTLSLGPAVAAVVPPGERAVDARLVDAAGAPMAGATIDFSVLSGPNAGVLASVDTDASGAASFTFTSDVAGADKIKASYTDGYGPLLEADALTIWDADCNANQIPDTCDLACDGWGGECAAFAGCGGSVDADANGLPDECRAANAPPDCSQASIVPTLLRRADHQFHEVAVSGVSDPDGDPIQVHIDAVFQDEPVDSFACGGGKPDAIGIGSDHVAVRAESLERGDGRVYHVSFSADDGRGGSCTGTAVVCVPRFGFGFGSRRSDSCVDQGPLYDSTVSKARNGFSLGWRMHDRD
jgi:hypothetical protein